MEKLRLLAFAVLISLSFSVLQAQPSQASDEMLISVVQPDGVKTVKKVSISQPLSKLRDLLVGKGLNIASEDKFLIPNLGELSPRDEEGVKVFEALDGKVLSFKPRSVSELLGSVNPDASYNLIEKVYANGVAYGSGIFDHYKQGITFSTLPHLPQKPRNQAVLNYDANPIPEKVLMKVIPGKDGRERIQDTTTWPNSIHAHLAMTLQGDTYSGSGVIVGPHHLLTCAHCVYEFGKGVFFEEISAYPALNGAIAPFNKVKATKAYMFKSYQDQGDKRFDMALLLLDQSIGDYTGWGGLLSAADEDLSQETVHITGYPGDKGCKQMWSMSHKIKTVESEVFDYEIDTYGGQSGSPVWINKYGTPLVLGVHTLGSNSINSGVRLSGEKFKRLFKVIADTYTLYPDLSGLSLGASTVLPVSSPAMASVIPVPLVARGYEAIYQRFLNGALLYRPNGDGNDAGMITLPIRALANPLEGTFDLSRCGDTGNYLSISTGYRKEKRPENASKLEIWFAPRFLIEKELNSTAAHFWPIMENWKQDAPVGMFWTWGGDGLGDYDYLTTENVDDLSKITLYENHKKSIGGEAILRLVRDWGEAIESIGAMSRFVCKLNIRSPTHIGQPT